MVWRLILSGMSFFVDFFRNQDVTDSGAFAALCYFDVQQKSYDRMQNRCRTPSHTVITFERYCYNFTKLQAETFLDSFNTGVGFGCRCIVVTVKLSGYRNLTIELNLWFRA